MKLKAFLMSEYLTRLSTFTNWTHSDISPFDLAAANFTHVTEFPHQKDIVTCEDCGQCLYQWGKGDIPIEEHKKFKPDCIFVKCFADNLSEITPTKKEIIDKWKTSVYAKIFSNLNFYTPYEVDEVLLHRLKKSYKFFSSIEEMFRYFLVYFKVKKCNSIEALNEKEKKTLSRDLCCKICLDNKASIVLVPCGHLTCGTCAKMIEKCPICNKLYIRSYRIYFA